MANIIDIFNKYFKIIPAISDELKIEVYKLRYQVYCIENIFLNSEDYQDKMESDEYDQQSVHYLIRHLKSGEYAATTRLILPDTNDPNKLFPLELNCKIDNLAVLHPINRVHLAEVSRFCVSKAFKQRKHEGQTLATIGPHWQDYFTQAEERRILPHFIRVLIACIISASYENDIHHLYAALEPAWLRFLSVMGINFIKIGPLADYHGERWPALIKITDLLVCVAEKNPDIWNLFTRNGSLLQDKPRESRQLLRRNCS